MKIELSRQKVMQIFFGFLKKDPPRPFQMYQMQAGNGRFSHFDWLWS